MYTCAQPSVRTSPADHAHSHPRRLFWEWDWAVARRTLHIWASGYYIGQVCKDILRLPRPPPAAVVEAAGLTGKSDSGDSTRAEAAHVHASGSSLTPLPSSPVGPSPGFFSVASSRFRALQGVVRLERHYEQEYGLPSTHAMNSIAMPWGLFLLSLSSGRYVGDALVLACVCTAWSVCCTLSRLYMGVHSPLDIWAGLALGTALLGTHLACGHAVDQLLTGSPWTALGVPLFTCLLLWAYPKPQTWVSTPGDTAVVLGAWTGVVVATSGSVLGHAHRQAMATPAAAWDALAAAAGGGTGGVAGGLASRVREALYTCAHALAPAVWLPHTLPKPTYSRFLPATGAEPEVQPLALAVRYFGTISSAQLRGMPARALVGFAVLLLTRAVVKACAMWLVRTLVEGVWGQAYETVTVPTEEGVAPLTQQSAQVPVGSTATGAAGALQAQEPRQGQGQEEGGEDAAGARTADGLRIRLPGKTSPGAVSASPSSGGDTPFGSASSASASATGGERRGGAGKGGKVALAAEWGGSPSDSLSSSEAAAGPESTREVRLPVPAARRYAIEIPVKLATYTAVGVNALYTAPWLFARLGLQYR